MAPPDQQSGSFYGHHMHQIYNDQQQSQYYSQTPPPPPPGAARPSLHSQPAPPPKQPYYRDYSEPLPPPPQPSATTTSNNTSNNNQQYSDNYSQQSPQYLPPIAQGQHSFNRDSMSDLIGAYADGSPASTSASLQGSPRIDNGSNNNDHATFASPTTYHTQSPSSYASPSLTNTSDSYIYQQHQQQQQSTYQNSSSSSTTINSNYHHPNLQRSQSAATPPERQYATVHAPPPLPTSASYSGYPSHAYSNNTPQSPSSFSSPYQQPPTNGYPSSSATTPRLPANALPSHPSNPSLRNQRLPRTDSQFSPTSPPPADAFYNPAEIDRKKSIAVHQAVTDAANSGNWRSALEASIAEDEVIASHALGSNGGAPPMRQPTILTTPPIGASSYHRPGGPASQRTPSLSSQASISSNPPLVSSTFASSSNAPSVYSTASTSTNTSGSSGSGMTRVANSMHNIQHRQGTLSPNASLNASSFLHRVDSSSSSFGFGGGGLSPSTTTDAGGMEEDYLNVALLSNLAVWLKDRVPTGPRLKGSLEHPDSFTGEEAVTTILARLPKTYDRRFAVTIARSLQLSLWFHDVDWVDSFKETSVYAFDDDGYIDEIPTGVLTSLTPCYSPFCGRLTEDGTRTSCYSRSCPNSSKSVLQRQASQQSTHSSLDREQAAAADAAPDDWIAYVGKEVAEKVDKSELKRQLNMYELIQGEAKYFNDFNLVQKYFIDPLVAANPPIIPPDRLPTFLNAILLNYAELREHSRKFLDNLKARQAQAPVLSGLGDLLLDAALEWGPAYVRYVSDYPWAHVFLNEELASNPRFREHAMAFSRAHPDTRVEFKSFQGRPTQRLGRYNMHSGDILKNSQQPSNKQDAELMKQAIDLINLQAKECNTGVAFTENKVQCREFHKSLITKNGDPYTTDFAELDLLNEDRKHVVSDKVVQKATTAGAIDAWSDGHWILFDNYLVMAKTPRGDTNSHKYIIPRRGIIPLEFIQLRPSTFTDPPIPKGSRFHLGTQRAISDGSTAGRPGAYPPPGSNQELLFPISLHRIGREEGTFTFYVDSAATRTKWAEKLPKAMEEHAEASRAKQVIALDVLSDQTFGGADTVIGSLVPPAPLESQFGNPTCSAPLTTADGQNLVVAGCAQGLFIGFRGKPRTMRQVVHLTGITQCAILPEYGFILVVAQKVLIAYSLEALVPSGGRLDPASKTPQRLSGSKDVLFMRAGKVGDSDSRTLVIYVKKSGVKESVFKALEPVSIAERNRAAGKHGLFGIGSSKNPEWFRTYKDFFLPSFVYSFRFIKSKLAIVCAKGVEIMNLDTLRTMSTPDFSHHRDEYSQKLAKRCDDSRTLGMFRLQENLFLLAYNGFCFHVDRHGEPLLRPVGVIEWESRPDQVAFQSPYIFGFSSKMIEIRNAFTGRLAQVITGREICLTYDGDGIDPGVIDVRSPSRQAPREDDTPERRLHVSMRVDSYHILYEVRSIR
ncbi:hypothetical protein T439DRAFT_378904 [Meredithblackwellia eburnea MCA 4105]